MALLKGGIMDKELKNTVESAIAALSNAVKMLSESMGRISKSNEAMADATESLASAQGGTGHIGPPWPADENGS